jgi:hypothetical protein
MSGSHSGKYVKQSNAIGLRLADVMKCNTMRPGDRIRMRTAGVTPVHALMRDLWQGCR